MENRHHRRLNNKGFSLVEMIIVMGILVVMTGVATVTVSMLKSAKAKEASVTFTSELSDMYTKSKNQMVVMDDGSGAKVNQPTYNYCMKLYSDGKRSYIKRGYYNPDGTSESTKYIFVDSENVNNGKGTGLSSKVYITYEGTDGVEKKITKESGSDNIEHVYIVFDRNGRCLEGSGSFKFYRTNGNVIAEVILKKNGSYQSD